MLKKSRICFIWTPDNKTHHIHTLPPTIPTHQSASFSVILSTAAYLLHEFPQLPHPRQPGVKAPHDRRDKEYPSQFLSLHAMFDEWVEILAECFFGHGEVARDGDTLYMKVRVAKECGEYLTKIQIPHTQGPDLPIAQIFKLPSKKANKKRVAWISCSTSIISRKMFAPSMNVAAILLGQIYNNEHYTHYTILAKQIPTVQQLLTFDTLIIPGSGLSVLDRHKEVDQMAANVMEAYRKSQSLKILGICYGHQLVAQLLGAKVVKRKRYGGLEEIRFNPSVIAQYQFLQPLSPKKYHILHLSQHHQDNVTTSPPQLYQLATSKSCQNEAFVSENGRIFSTQFHPEYNYTFAKAFTARMQVYYSDGERVEKPSSSHQRELVEGHLEACQVMRLCITQKQEQQKNKSQQRQGTII